MQRPLGLDVDQVEDRRHHTHRGDRNLNDRPRGNRRRVAHDQRNPGSRLVDRDPVAVAQVLAYQLAVIGEHDQEGRVERSALAQCVAHATQQHVRVQDAGVVHIDGRLDGGQLVQVRRSELVRKELHGELLTLAGVERAVLRLVLLG